MQNTIETTTWHDRKPTRVDPLATLRQNMVDEWNTHNALVDKYAAGIVTDRSILDTAREIAIAADRAYFEAYMALNAPAPECTCTPVNTCAECADKANLTAELVAAGDELVIPFGE